MRAKGLSNQNRRAEVQTEFDFQAKSTLRLVRLTERDVLSKSDSFREFCDQILQCEEMYPSISKWVTERVVPGIGGRTRAGFVAYEGSRPIASAVVKCGTNAKFCHLRIADDFQDKHLGEMFFCLMAMEVRGKSSFVHFTLPESLWAQRQQFFNSFGFSQAQCSQRQYRRGDTELTCSVPFSALWRATVEKMPKLLNHFSPDEGMHANSLLLTLRPPHADAIMAGKKTVEIRRRFSEKWNGHAVAFYSSTPVNSLVGEAVIEHVERGDPENVWERYAGSIGCTKEQYDAYVHGAQEVFAIHLARVVNYSMPIRISTIAEAFGAKLCPPQSYVSLRETSDWGTAVSLATFLRSRTFENLLV
jgi:predicted transcriptional regulator